MADDLWSKALSILKADPKIDSVIYESILCKMKQVNHDPDGTIILSCRDEYSMSVVKGQNIDSYIKGALRLITEKNYSVNYVEEGNEPALITTTVAQKKVMAKSFSATERITSEFTFENFVVGDCNRFAHASAISVATHPGSTQRNPLYLWGNSGLGKTHLMKAVGYRIKENYPEKTVLYTTCEEFTNAFVACMNNSSYESFRNKYRTVDVLLIDDIQFLIGKEGTQTEFFNTFEALITSGKQIVITSDKAPKNLTELDNRLTSRFQSGILMDIQPPDFETRKAIFISKLEHDNIVLSDDIINYVCENVTRNVRELNGAYNMVSACYALMNGNLTFEEVEQRLQSFISPGKTKKLTPEIVIEAVSHYYDITPEKMMSKLRNAEIVDARNVAMYICRDLLEMQYEKIGACFGGRKHTTVMNGCNNIDKNDSLLKDIEIIKRRIVE